MNLMIIPPFDNYQYYQVLVKESYILLIFLYVTGDVSITILNEDNMRQIKQKKQLL